jgi:hypothetical protein
VDDKNEALKDILEGDYKFVLISGEYFDCPSCNDITSFSALTFFDEKDLLKHILAVVGKDRLEAIWVLDCYCSGNMVKCCDIKTSTGFHKIAKIELDLPEQQVIIETDKAGNLHVLSAAEMVLRGSSSNSKV